MAKMKVISDMKKMGFPDPQKSLELFSNEALYEMAVFIHNTKSLIFSKETDVLNFLSELERNDKSVDIRKPLDLKNLLNLCAEIQKDTIYNMICLLDRSISMDPDADWRLFSLNSDDKPKMPFGDLEQLFFQMVTDPD